MLSRHVNRGGSQELELGGNKQRRNIVHSEQKCETAQRRNCPRPLRPFAEKRLNDFKQK